jgi:ribosome-binding protein aMBF1 (putative translation factor)
VIAMVLCELCNKKVDKTISLNVCDHCLKKKMGEVTVDADGEFEKKERKRNENFRLL